MLRIGRYHFTDRNSILMGVSAAPRVSAVCGFFFNAARLADARGARRVRNPFLCSLGAAALIIPTVFPCDRKCAPGGWSESAEQKLSLAIFGRLWGAVGGRGRGSEKD